MSIARTIAGLPGDACISGFVLDGTGSTVDEIRAALERAPDCERPEGLRALAGLKQLAPVQLCVVYFLVRDGVVVYVGQTKSSWPRRVWQHARDREKHFDDVWYVECKDAATMMQMEARYIRELWPEYNRIGKRLTRVDRELLRHEITRGRGGEP